ncbi:translation initiation factor IF-5A [Candidatus Micrarchaeota archaeon]|nr:translation initiation factor IF-5A [Candidatus Micrarchaeota archaeon]
MSEGDVNIVQMKDLKEGKLVIIDDEPCKITSIQKSKPGKHGAAKMRVEGASLLSGNKKTLLKNVDASCEVPVLVRKHAQVIANMGGNKLQVMDRETYETYDMDVEPEYGSLQSGQEIEVQDVMGKKSITHVKKEG